MTESSISGGGERTGRERILAQLAKPQLAEPQAPRPPLLAAVRATKFGVLPVFGGLGGKLKMQRVLEVGSALEAKRVAETSAMILGGAIAFSKRPGPAGEEEGAIILDCFGDVPDGIRVLSTGQAPKVHVPAATDATPPGAADQDAGP